MGCVGQNGLNTTIRLVEKTRKKTNHFESQEHRDQHEMWEFGYGPPMEGPEKENVSFHEAVRIYYHFVENFGPIYENFQPVPGTLTSFEPPPLLSEILKIPIPLFLSELPPLPLTARCTGAMGHSLQLITMNTRVPPCFRGREG